MINRYLNLFWNFTKQNIKTLLEYRADFFIGAGSIFFIRLIEVLFIWAIFQNIQSIKGWSFHEIMMVYGLMTLVRGIYVTFFGVIWEIGYYIDVGYFDIYLLRPINPLFHFIANKFDQEGIGNIIIGSIAITKSLWELNIPLNIGSIGMMILFTLSGTIIYGGIILMSSTLSFWMVDSFPINWGVTSLRDFALYPTNIFSKFIQVLVTWIIPFAFVSFYPANYFLHKGYENLSLLSPVIALIIGFLSLKFWSFGIKHYTSTGS